MLPWMFALDHTHYSRWLPVFLEDLKKLNKNKAVYQNFLQGFFTVSRSNRKFSRMGIDQAHEQNNKIVKVDGGAIGILDDEAALLKWAVAGPIISKMIEDVDCDIEGHHEDTAKFEADFQMKRSSLIQAFVEIGNPFLEHEDNLIHLISKQVMNEAARDSVINSKDIGNEQLTAFLADRIIGNTTSIYDTIKKNNLSLFRHKNSIVISNKKKQVIDLVADRRLFSSLYVACQSRQGNLESFFKHENHSYPVSISEYGKLRKCSKSDFLKCLPDDEELQTNSPDVEAKIIDGAAFVNMNMPRKSNTLGEYIDELAEKINSYCKNTGRVDVVFDTYLPDSIKSETRENRGSGMRVIVKDTTPLPRKFSDFMRNDENKTELFQMISERITIKNTTNMTSTIISTNFQNVLSNKQMYPTCNHVTMKKLIHVYSSTQRMHPTKVSKKQPL